MYVLRLEDLCWRVWNCCGPVTGDWRCRSKREANVALAKTRPVIQVGSGSVPWLQEVKGKSPICAENNLPLLLNYTSLLGFHLFIAICFARLPPWPLYQFSPPAPLDDSVLPKMLLIGKAPGQPVS